MSHTKTLDVCGSLLYKLFSARVQCSNTVTNTRHRKNNNQSFVRNMYSEMLKMKYISVGLQFEVL